MHTVIRDDMTSSAGFYEVSARSSVELACVGRSQRLCATRMRRRAKFLFSQVATSPAVGHTRRDECRAWDPPRLTSKPMCVLASFTVFASPASRSSLRQAHRPRTVLRGAPISVVICTLYSSSGSFKCSFSCLATS